MTGNRILLIQRIAEKDFQHWVQSYAEFHGWKIFHPYDSRRSAIGWPDLFLVRGDRALALEVKSNTGRLRPGQQAWLDALALVPGITARIIRPADEAEVRELLR